jgi:hypothetical protein
MSAGEKDPARCCKLCEVKRLLLTTLIKQRCKMRASRNDCGGNVRCCREERCTHKGRKASKKENKRYTEKYKAYRNIRERKKEVNT